MNIKLKSLKIGKHTIKYPIFQGGMGVGISWDELAGNVSKEGALGIISAVGTGYYKKMHFVEKIVSSKPFEAINFYSKQALIEIFKNARKICGANPLGANILYAINEYGRVVRDACEAGANIIVTGAGLPTNMPEFTKNFPEVALVPIVSSVKALRIICKRWEERYQRLPDAVIVEGPLSGGHQGFKYEDCFKEEFQLENLVPQIAQEAQKWGNIPVIAAGGIWDRNDIDKMLALGASGVQMGTRFLGTKECDAKAYAEILPHVKKEDIKLVKSPVGYPARAINIGVLKRIEEGTAPKIKCISNCVSPCHRGIEAKAVGYCIADSLGKGHMGDKSEGLYFSGANGYRIEKIVSVKELIHELTQE
ncbi:2-nitropropane dioxygenase [Helicobacter sp. 12S02634-8]|uniref:nitronate monooxygenase n=1 Tax=Helicobacter sp. 12S02634-8 TaxID=1476199 RepID=UPI000BA615D8|nr:nitronate monooxygenase [Helicobacter sp. 12S02634-8]PAF48555.1 2-nitropropane dioxygenase [Helicobacter sp. 12S02634-8]